MLLARFLLLAESRFSCILCNDPGTSPPQLAQVSASIIVVWGSARLGFSKRGSDSNSEFPTPLQRSAYSYFLCHSLRPLICQLVLSMPSERRSQAKHRTLGGGIRLSRVAEWFCGLTSVRIGSEPRNPRHGMHHNWFGNIYGNWFPSRRGCLDGLALIKDPTR